MHLLLFGGTGLVGGAALQAMISRPDITKVTCVSRRPVPAAEGKPKVEVLLHKDFESYDDSFLSQIKDATGCVWALGISQTAVSKDQYVKITHDYTMAAARALQKAKDGADFNFVYVSGEGATHSPGRFTPIFGRCKGATELELFALAKASSEQGGLRAFSVRPGGVDPSQHPELLPYIPKQPIWHGPALSVTKNFFSGMHSPTKPLGEYLVGLAAGDFGSKPLSGPGVENDGWLVTNVGFRSKMNL